MKGYLRTELFVQQNMIVTLRKKKTRGQIFIIWQRFGVIFTSIWCFTIYSRKLEYEERLNICYPLGAMKGYLRCELFSKNWMKEYLRGELFIV